MFIKNNNESHGKSVKFIALLASLLLILGVIVGGTIAFLADRSGDVINTFTPSQVTTEVTEVIDGTTKSNVQIKNTGDTEAWIRAAVVVTWQDAAGNVYGKKPVEGTDYSILCGTGWRLGEDGFYYWLSSVAAGSETGNLIDSCTTAKTITEGETTYYLAVEIIGSGIQSKPASVFNTEWESSGLVVNDSNADPMQWVLQ